MAPARDPVEAVARIADARRDRLLRIHRRRLRWEDLEDCYSQATLELVARAQRSPFASAEHIHNALEQKFSSRIDDRRRAIGGRSPIETAIATAVPVDLQETGGCELADPNAEVVRQVVSKMEVSRLREVADELTEDQRLVLACQISMGMDCAEFCRRFGWSGEKFRKVAQRGRSRLRALVAEYQVGARCERLEPDLMAFAARVATEEQTRRATAHLANCTACSAHLRALDRASRQVAALLPAPVIVRAGLVGKFGGVLVTVRRVLGIVGARAEPGAAGVAGGSAVGAGALKVGVAAVCLAGAAGGYAICGGVPVTRPASHRVAKVTRARSATPADGGRPAVVTAAVVSRQNPGGGGDGSGKLARGRLAVEVAEREFSGTVGHAADVAGPAGSLAPTGSPAGGGSPAGSPAGGESPGPTGTPAGSGSPADGSAGASGSGVHTGSAGSAGATGAGESNGDGSSPGPTGSPVAAGTANGSSSSAAAGAGEGHSAGQAQSEFGGFEH
jgi:DNA-directed RNA polymerase specialized sigma24 family protein